MAKKQGDRRFAFTMKRLQILPIPETGRVDYYDATCRGLVVTVSASGSRTFYYVGRILGTVRRLKLGAVGSLSIPEARQAVAQIVAGAARGKDEGVERQKRRKGQGLTLKRVFDYSLEVGRKWRRSVDVDIQMYKHLADWGDRNIGSITVEEWQQWHAKVGEKSGPSAANRARAVARKLYNMAEQDLGFTGRNPVARVRKFPEESRSRVLSLDEIGRFLRVARQSTHPLNAAIQFALFTGARRSNVTSAEWAEIDLEGRLWTIPASKAKGKKDIRIPLSPRALEIVQERRRTIPMDRPFVFGITGQKPLAFARRIWTAILRDAEITGVTPHDLRRTLATCMVLANVQSAVISKALGHSNGAGSGGAAITGVYMRPGDEEVRRAFEAAALLIEGTVNQPRAQR